MLTYEAGKRILRNSLEVVMWFSDKAYQQKAWIQGEGPNDFDELVCHFFDNNDPVFIKYNFYGITKKQYKILKKFREELEAFSDKHSYEPAFINTPEWDQIISIAKEVLIEFDYPN